MNESSLKYTAYKALLEGEITRDQYDFITEAGLVSRIIKSLRAAGGAAAKTYKDEAYNDAQQYASQQLQKIVKQIYQAGAKAGQDKSQIDPIVAMILNQAMVDSKIENPALVFKALEKSPEAIEVVSEPSSSAASSGEGGSSGGAPLTPDTIKSNPEVAAAVAAAVMPDKKEQIVAAVEKGKKIPPDFIYNAIATNASEKTGVKKEVAQKIVMALVDAKRLTVSANIEAVLESIRTRHSGNVIFERWQVLAGVRGANLLSEIEVPDDLKAAFQNNKYAKKFVDMIEKDDLPPEEDIEKFKGIIKKKVELSPFVDKVEELVGELEKKLASKEDEPSEDDSSDDVKKLKDKESETVGEDIETYLNILRSPKELKNSLEGKDDDFLDYLLAVAIAASGTQEETLEDFKNAIKERRNKNYDEVRTKKLEDAAENWTIWLQNQSKNGEDDTVEPSDVVSDEGSDKSSSENAAESGEDLGKIKPILDDIRKKVAVEEASDKDVVAVLKFIKDEIKELEISAAA